MQAEPDDDDIRTALRMPDTADAALRDEVEEPTPSRSSEPDLLIPIVSIGSFAGFGAIIANEYLTRGFCPPFLNTCLSVAEDNGWSV